MNQFLGAVYRCFHTAIAELNSCNRDFMGHKTRNTYCLSPYSKFILSLPKTKLAKWFGYKERMIFSYEFSVWTKLSIEPCFSLVRIYQ